MSNPWTMRGRVIDEVSTSTPSPTKRRRICIAHREGRAPETRDPECHNCRRDLIAERAEILRRFIERGRKAI